MPMVKLKVEQEVSRKINVVLSLSCDKAQRGRSGTAPRSLNLGARKRQVVSVMLRPPYPWEIIKASIEVKAWWALGAGLDM